MSLMSREVFFFAFLPSKYRDKYKAYLIDDILDRLYVTALMPDAHATIIRYLALAYRHARVRKDSLSCTGISPRTCPEGTISSHALDSLVNH